ncbi:hypothetical protein [Yoonia sp.]|uniref:hypothetical protein n=1 Tax=Yoonia sp. TaxID=2212373 RepID=UPI003A4E54AC
MRYLVTSLFMLTGATTATAQGFAGASIDVTHLRFPDIKEIEATDFSASADFDVASGFGLGASITSRDQATDAGSADVTGLTTLRDSQPEAFSDGVFLTADEGAAAGSNSTAQLIEAGSEPRL